MMHHHPKPQPGSSDLTVVVDKNDTVLSATRTGNRWRFKRLRPRATRGTVSRFSDEQEQEMCAMYVDSPETRTDDIAEMFGISPGGFYAVLDAYDVPKRKPAISAGAKNRKKPGATETVLRTSTLEYAQVPVVNPNAEIAQYAQDYNTRHDDAKLKAKLYGRSEHGRSEPGNPNTEDRLDAFGFRMDSPPVPTAAYPQTVWLVTVTRTVVEEVTADTLLELAAHYDGTDARIVRIERKA